MTERPPNSETGESDCPPANHLAAAVNGTLQDAALEHQIVAHLGECQQCQTTVDELAGTEELAEQLEALNETRAELPPKVRSLVEDLAPDPDFMTEDLSSADEFPTLQIPEEPPIAQPQKPSRVSRGAIVEVSVLAILVMGTIAVFWWPDDEERGTSDSDNWPAPSSTGIEDLASVTGSAESDGGRPLPPVKPDLTPGRENVTDGVSEQRFTLLSPEGRRRLQSSSMEDVLDIALRNDVVEIRHDGELTLANQLINAELEIRSATGCRPVLVPELNADGSFAPLFRCRVPVRFRGLTMATPEDAVVPSPPRPQTLIHVERGSVEIEDCEFDLRRPGFEDIAIRVRSAASVELSNSQCHGGATLDLDLQTPCRLDISNSLLHGACPLILHHYPDGETSTVSFSNSTIIAETICSLVTQQSLELREEPPILWRAEDSIFMARDTLFSLSKLATAGTKDTFDQVLGDSLWCVADCRSKRCVFAIEQRFLAGSRSTMLFRPTTREEIARRKRIPRVDTLSHFCKVTGAQDDDSVEVSFQIDAALLAPASLKQLKELQADLLVEAAKSAQRDLSGRGSTYER